MLNMEDITLLLPRNSYRNPYNMTNKKAQFSAQHFYKFKTDQP